MIALDTNIIIYILVRSQPEHAKAQAWFDTNETEQLVTTHTNIAEVLRLLTHPRVFPNPTSLKDAAQLVATFVDTCNISVLAEQDDWWRVLPSLLKDHPGLRGNEVFDARIALCLRHHGVKVICSMDADFLKYPFLKRVAI